MGRIKFCIALAVVLRVGMLEARAQQEASRPAPSKASAQSESTKASGSDTKAKSKTGLASVTRVSTADALQQASADAAKQGRGLEEVGTPGDSRVVEFRAVNSAGGSADASVTSKSSGKIKDVHGTAYGRTGSGNRAAGGAVGATSSSGKTSVYIQGERARTDQAAPSR